MYLPAQFAASEPDLADALMRAHPFASLISVDEAGEPFVTHLPLHLEQRGAQRVLLGHCARGNPHGRLLQARPRALVTFLGPQAYLSPSVYPDLARVPTWNYLAVHATVTATLVESPDAKDALLKKLIGDHEPAYAEQWRALGEDFARRMLGGIVAFELAVERIECKIKLNQHRPESHAAMHAAYAGGDDNARALAGWMARIGLVGTDASTEGRP